MMDNKKEEKKLTAEIFVEKKKPKLITSLQAFKAIGGNQRLEVFVSKKLKGEKTFDDWKYIFNKRKIT